MFSFFKRSLDEYVDIVYYGFFVVLIISFIIKKLNELI